MLEISGRTEVHGALIYPTKVRFGDVIEARWAAQFRENIGSGRLGGAHLCITKEDAIEQANKDYEAEQKKNKLDQIELDFIKNSQDEKAKRKANNMNGFIAGDTPANKAELIRKNLEKIISINGVVKSIQAHIDSFNAESILKIDTEEVNKIKDPSRRPYHRMDNREQASFKAKQIAAGKKNVYWVNNYELGKTAYDYASYLLIK